MPDDHSLLSASGSDGWIPCNGKPLMEEGRRTSSEYADEGTAAHTLAERVLTLRIEGQRASALDYLGEVITVSKGATKRKFTVDREFADYVNDYVDAFFWFANRKGALRFAERRVHYHEALGVDKSEAWGTGDGFALILDAPACDWEDDAGTVHHFPAGVELQVHDLKFGKGVRVFAQKNGQMRHYGLGGLWEFAILADVTRIRMVIHQPRLDHTSEELISVKELVAWSAEARAAAQVVKRLWNTPGLRAPKGGFRKHADVPAELAKHLKPTDKGCRFCDAKAICPALRREVHGAVSGRSEVSDFEDLEVDSPKAVGGWGDNWLAMFASKLDQIEMLTKAARAEIDRRVLLQGKSVDGFKVVAGRKGDRSWRDKAKAEKALAVMRLDHADMFKYTLISPTQAEKLLAKTAPVHWATLQDNIYRAEGKPAVVHVTDPRPAIEHRAVADDFEDESEAQEAAAFAPTSPHPFR